MGDLWSPFGTPWEDLESPLGALWETFGTLSSPFGTPWDDLGRPWETFGAPSEPLGMTLEPVRDSGPLGMNLGAIRDHDGSFGRMPSNSTNMLRSKFWHQHQDRGQTLRANRPQYWSDSSRSWPKPSDPKWSIRRWRHVAKPRRYNYVKAASGQISLAPQVASGF